jgi:hypothetical protein
MAAICDTEVWDVICGFSCGAARLRWSVAGLGREQLVSRPGPGEWSIQEVVVHLADSDAIGIDRMKRIICEDRPTLMNYDESAYIRRLSPHEQDLRAAMVLFEFGREQMVRVLERLEIEEFAREGVHSVEGPVSLLKMVKKYEEHVEGHIGFILAKRERMGLGLLETAGVGGAA